MRVRITYHPEPHHGWWADSPDVSGWSASADNLEDLRAAVPDGLRFALETDEHIEIVAVIDAGSAPAVPLEFGVSTLDPAHAEPVELQIA